MILKEYDQLYFLRANSFNYEDVVYIFSVDLEVGDYPVIPGFTENLPALWPLM